MLARLFFARDLIAQFWATMAGKKDKIRQAARDYYIENVEITQKEIAELFSITEKTVSAWSNSEDWNNKRLEYHSSPVKIKEYIQKELLNVVQGKPATLNADGISKLMSALDRVEKKADPIVVSKILKDLDNFISEDDPEFAIRCTHYHKQFLIHRINLEA
ncbi:hypothetical protein [Peijinzhouia sedimentorum]